MVKFAGFSQDTIAFLHDVKEKNSKEWFEDHRQIYRSHVIDPLSNLMDNLAPTLQEIDPQFDIIPRIGRSISRLNRDTRFSRDKSRYRDRAWFSFKRPSKRWQEEPVYFFEISTEGYCYGMGYYCATRTSMDLFRKSIDNQLASFKALIEPFKSASFELVGQNYKRILNPNLPQEILDWYQKKSWALLVRSPLYEEAFSGDFIKQVEAHFLQMGPLYSFMRNIEAKRLTIENQPEDKYLTHRSY